MAYEIIQPPFSLRFVEMPKKQLRAYNSWFHEVLPARILELEKAVQATPGFEDWAADRRPESLSDLGRWFEGQVETRSKTEAELAEDNARLVFPIDVPDVDLTNRSFSLAIDIGMYFSQVVLKALPGARWDQPLKNTKLAEYGRPVLMGFGPVPLDPVGVLVSTAYGISRGKPAKLDELFEVWRRMWKP